MPNNVYADLHVHSNASDGTFTPAEVVEHAARLGLGAVALTDHDTVAGLQAAAAEARTRRIDLVPGIEMGSDVSGRDIHILGYFVDYLSLEFLTYLEDLKEKRLERAEQMCQRLTAAGVPLTLEDALRQTTNGLVTRAHIARAVVAGGYAHDIGEVFDRYLGNGKPCFVPKYNFTAADVIAAIKKAGGVPVLAHPKLSRVDDMIPDLAASGLMGVETYCIDHTPVDIKRYAGIAKQYGLLITGGSDCHGPRTPGRFTMGSRGVDKAALDTLKLAAGRPV
jgi:3',5'-nucleoside bisphosphate phosphatase